MGEISDEAYTIGHSEAALKYMRFRTAERFCGFVKDKIKSDSAILDCGCGPGTITVGLADWSPDGETIGIDLGSEQQQIGRNIAKERGIGNVTFQEGSIFELPFPDDSFDVVFASFILCHLAKPEDALAQMFRVTRPGGHVAVQDCDCQAFLAWPDDEAARLSLATFANGMKKSGGDPNIGRKLGRLVADAGLELESFSFTYQQPRTAAERDLLYSGIAHTVEKSDLAKLALAEGWATERDLEAMGKYYRDAIHDLSRLALLPVGQALGRKPLVGHSPD
jgi:ubiquinone/menaquinone biosynthesis C-methylase UbiE